MRTLIIEVVGDRRIVTRSSGNDAADIKAAMTTAQISFDDIVGWKKVDVQKKKSLVSVVLDLEVDFPDDVNLHDVLECLDFSVTFEPSGTLEDKLAYDRKIEDEIVVEIAGYDANQAEVTSTEPVNG